LLLLFILFSCVFLHVRADAAENAYAKTMKIQLKNGETRDVNTVWIDMKDPYIRVEGALAKNKVGEIDTFENIYNGFKNEDTEVIAAINGPFYNAYIVNSRFDSNIQIKGKFVFTQNKVRPSIGFTADNRIKTDVFFPTVSGSLNDLSGLWTVWGINKIYYHNKASKESNILYTPEFGNSIDAGEKTAVIVRNNKVVAIQNGVSPIYNDGFTLVFYDETYSSLFKIGDKVDYDITYNKVVTREGDFTGESLEEAIQSLPWGNNEETDWSDVRTTIGAGPILLKNGEKQKLNIIDLIDRDQRSFIGETEDRFLVMGTVDDVILDELADILKNMGLMNAINLDGGATSALMFDGKVITSPESDLCSALVITRKKEKTIRIQLNGKEMFFDTDPYFYNQRTMVPLRGILEAVGATVEWDPSTGTIMALKGDIKVEMWNDSKIIRVNGKEQEMDVPVQVRYNRTHVPVRFITEVFGAEVNFNPENNMVTIIIENYCPTDI